MPRRADIGRLYDQFGASLYRYALMILADPSAAADAVHDVFVAVMRGNAALDNAGHYLRRAVRNECYSALRKRRIAASSNDPLLEAVTADDPDLRIAIERALRALPPEQREVVHLKAFDGMTFQEIADATGESINTIASRYRYAMEKMRAQLG
jgi:RNA polymerase sigma-70 factor (ECF subfamily)